MIRNNTPWTFVRSKDIGHAQPVPDGIRVALDEKKARKLP